MRRSHNAAAQFVIFIVEVFFVGFHYFRHKKTEMGKMIYFY